MYMEVSNEFAVFPESLARRWHRTSLNRVKDLTTGTEIEDEYATYFLHTAQESDVDQPD